MDNWTEEDLKKLMDELENNAKASGFKWPIYHDNGLVSFSSDKFVCVARADSFNKFVGNAAYNLVHEKTIKKSDDENQGN